MKVILRESIAKLGKRGDVISVKPGYARNYLLPRNLAVVSTKENMRRIEAEKRQWDIKQAAIKEERQALAQRLQGTQLTMMVRAHEGVLYGAINERQILEAFTAEGIKLTEQAIVLDRPVKEIGPHEFRIHLHADIPDVVCKLFVVPQND